MSEHDDDTGDELSAAYRRASAADAGQPSAATRAAILAEARAVAAKRTAPAANEPWFRRSAISGLAASIAIAGVALVLWRQTGREPAAVAPRATDAAAARQEQTQDARKAAPLAAAAAAPSTNTRALLQREFPQLLQSGAAPRDVWLLQDASGRTLRTGTLEKGQSFAAVTLQLQGEMPGRRIAAFDVRNVTTEQGTTVQVGVARVE
jgi:hypothetical protein